jgi:hypothetical protein
MGLSVQFTHACDDGLEFFLATQGHGCFRRRRRRKYVLCVRDTNLSLSLCALLYPLDPLNLDDPLDPPPTPRNVTTTWDLPRRSPSRNNRTASQTKSQGTY